ncbi:transcription initiation factor IIB-like [Durio zibethinus]|uniref:Transcription initiation factor IIB-like n=1 Tax=Durio zibethinus TaxID=66656 RepID=A0A6P5YNF8_DURZI|nr:transcription initiation factor IIB-like [Durio zibethinus]
MDDKDPERVGSKVNPLLEHGNMTSWIFKTKGAPAGSFTSLNESNLDRTLVKGFGIIGVIADREIRSSRTLKEISTVANGASKKEINRAIEVIKKRLEVDMGTVQPGELVRRFCSTLGMNNQAIKAVQEAIIMVVLDLDIRRNQESEIGFGGHYLHDKSEIAVAVEVAEGTIKKFYKALAPYALRLVPQWNDEKVKKN